MHTKRIAITTATLAASLALTASAQAARPTLSLTRADHAARTWAHHQKTIRNADELDYRKSDGFSGVTHPLVIRAGFLTDYDGCDRETRYRAICDVTFQSDDGFTEAVTITLVVTRRGYYKIVTS